MTDPYTLVLKMYVHINRQAPVPPPTPAEVQKAFETADADRDGRLDRSEFRRLMVFFYARNSTRIIVFRAFRHLLAPLLALQLDQDQSGFSRFCVFGKHSLHCTAIRCKSAVEDRDRGRLLCLPWAHSSAHCRCISRQI